MRVSVYLFAHGARGEARVLRGDPQSVLQGCHAGLRDVEQYGLRGSGQGSALRVREGLRGGQTGHHDSSKLPACCRDNQEDSDSIKIYYQFNTTRECLSLYRAHDESVNFNVTLRQVPPAQQGVDCSLRSSDMNA